MPLTPCLTCGRLGHGSYRPAHAPRPWARPSPSGLDRPSATIRRKVRERDGGTAFAVGQRTSSKCTTSWLSQRAVRTTRTRSSPFAAGVTRPCTASAMLPKRTRLKWGPIIDRAAEIVLASSLPMTLRQLFYRLVAEELIPNKESPYKRLSRLTARSRREGRFPRLIDPTRQLHVPTFFASPADARLWLREEYRRERTEGQPHQLVIAVEKATQFGFLRSWFDDLGVTVAALRGFSSQTQADDFARLVEADPRPTVLIYAGDYDPSGEDIIRDFLARAGNGLADVRHVALHWDQVVAYDLPPQFGKASDSRAAKFAAKHGRLVQVELEALAPDVLRDLYQAAINDYWDEDAYRAVLEQEAAERSEL